jgi:hypothetical protein
MRGVDYVHTGSSNNLDSIVGGFHLGNDRRDCPDTSSYWSITEEATCSH